LREKLQPGISTRVSIYGPAVRSLSLAQQIAGFAFICPELGRRDQLKCICQTSNARGGFKTDSG